MNKKIYKGYELIKAIEDGQIEEGTILTFTSTIAKDNKKEVEVIRRPEGLVLFKKDIPETLPTSWLFNSKIEILEDNTEEIEEYKGETFEQLGYEVGKMSEEEIIDILQNVICDEVIGTYCLEIQKTTNCSKNCEKEDCYLIQAIEGIIDLYNKEKEKNKKLIDGQIETIEKILAPKLLEKFISKDKIKEKIEELGKKEKEELKGTKGQDRYNIKQEFMFKKNILQELLEE